MSFEKVVRETKDRRRWNRINVHQVTNLRNEDGKRQDKTIDV